MDLDRHQALKMTVKTIGGTDYLFIEAGGSSTRNLPGVASAVVCDGAGREVIQGPSS